MGRVHPRECAAEAKRNTDLAYGKYASDPKAQQRFILDAVDWLRRAVEQLADLECPTCESRNRDYFLSYEGSGGKHCPDSWHSAKGEG